MFDVLYDPNVHKYVKREDESRIAMSEKQADECQSWNANAECFTVKSNQDY